MQEIEDVAMDRALNGIEVPVYSYGKLVGSRKIYNDRLMMFMLRNRSPERFSEGRLGGGAKDLKPKRIPEGTHKHLRSGEGWYR